LAGWNKKQKAAPVDFTTPFGWGRASMEKLAKAYKREWCDTLENAISFLKMGFAQYEVNNYDEALYVFERMQQSAEKSQNKEHEALALIWQAHMLDLLGKRAEAVARYKQVADMNIKSTWKHSQYGLDYEVSAYAKERMTKPFVRIENREQF
jgi:tetratricopeptide (TPR) repeat protein